MYAVGDNEGDIWWEDIEDNEDVEDIAGVVGNSTEGDDCAAQAIGCLKIEYSVEVVESVEIEYDDNTLD